MAYESDKLPALAGFADNDQYVAGMWLSDFHRQLLWSWPSTGDPKNYSKFKVPTKYRAPSFSWASVDGPLAMYFDKFESRMPWNEGREEGYDDPYSIKVEIWEVDTVFSTINPLGAVASGFLILSGYVGSLTYTVEAEAEPLRTDTKMTSDHDDDNRTEFQPQSNKLYYQLTFDFPYESNLGKQVSCVQVSKTRQNVDNETIYDGAIVHVLAVEPIDDGTYRRIGVGWVYQHVAEGPEWQVKTLTLI